VLDLSGIPLRSAERGDARPLIIAGGPTATHPEPLAPFIDAFFIGEGEEALPALVREAAALARAGVPRRERLIRLAASFPLYVPELYDTEIDAETGLIVVGRAGGRARPGAAEAGAGRRHQPLPVPRRFAAAVREAIFDRMAVEVARGLHRGLPLLPGGDDLPPGARARSGRRCSTRW
jgi:radical SAM superfamily enzyme YgiQ (UPF0313 family)